MGLNTLNPRVRHPVYHSRLIAEVVCSLWCPNVKKKQEPSMLHPPAPATAYTLPIR